MPCIFYFSLGEKKKHCTTHEMKIKIVVLIGEKDQTNKQTNKKIKRNILHQQLYLYLELKN